MKKFSILAVTAAISVICPGCASTITHYDGKGNVIKQEKTTNFSRAMDGTNSKSQMLLIDGTFAGFDAGTAAGNNSTPGISLKFANGKTAIVNAKDSGSFTGADKVVKEFFEGELNIGSDGMTKK